MIPVTFHSALERKAFLVGILVLAWLACFSAIGTPRVESDSTTFGKEVHDETLKRVAHDHSHDMEIIYLDLGKEKKKNTKLNPSLCFTDPTHS